MQAVRQPNCSITNATTGQVKVVAKPEIRVIPVMALPARSAYSAPSVAKSASYSPIAIPAPMTTQARKNHCKLWQLAMIRSPLPTTIPLAASCMRPP
ncbi:hypothetical protein D9M71_513770 [compost metagenome]